MSLRFYRIATALILILALALRLWPLPGTWLWSDEIFSVSLAEAGWWKALTGTFRHDLHPPFYYLQLVPWAALFKSDAGLLLNSVLWDMARIALTIYVLRRMVGREAALAGGIAAVFLGPSLYNAENLRMYALMGCAAVAAWALTERLFRDGRAPTRRDAVLLFLAQLAIVGSHGAGPFLVVVFGLYGLVLWYERGGSWRRHLPWLITQILTALAALAVMVNGAMRATEHYQIGWSWQELLTPLGFMSAGITLPMGSGAGILAGTLVTLAIIALGLATRPARRVTLIFLVTPLVMTFLISVFIKPIWGFRIFLNASAFLPVVLGLSLAGFRAKRRTAGLILSTVCILCLIGFGLHQRIFYQKEHNYPAMAAFLRENARPGDVIVQEHQPATAWALGRYLIGPGWGDIMSVQHPDSAKWQALFERLGPRFRAIFASRSDEMLWRGIPIGLGEAAANRLIPGAERVWLAASFAWDEKAIPEILKSRDPTECFDFSGAFLCRYDKSD